MGELSQEIRIAQQVIEAIKAAGIDETDEDFVDLVEAECDVFERLRRMIRAADREEAEAEACRALAKQMADRASRKDAKAESLKAMVLQGLQDLGQTKLTAPDFKLSVVTTQARKLVGSADPATLPDALVRIKREPDKTAIKAALEAGEAVEGYSLSNAAPYLRIQR